MSEPDEKLLELLRRLDTAFDLNGVTLGKISRRAISIATAPSDELFVLYNTGEMWRYYYPPGRDGRKWEKLDLPSA